MELPNDETAKEAQELSLEPLGDSGPCPLHGTPQQLDRVPIRYGYIIFAPDYLDAWREQFPYAHTFSPGGCMTFPGMPLFQTVYHCPDCREAEKEWAARHPRPAQPVAEPAADAL